MPAASQGSMSEQTNAPAAAAETAAEAATLIQGGGTPRRASVATEVSQETNKRHRQRQRRRPQERSRSMTRPSVSRCPASSRRIMDPTPPDTLVELHIYLVPKEKWLETRRLAKNQVVDDSVSVGFVRVIPELSIHNLRREVLLQLGPDVIPSDYVFLRSVGRNFTQVKVKQEHQLKAKNFVPPCAPEPEIYLLDARETRDTSLPRLGLRTDSPALRLSINRKSDPAESPLPVSPSPASHHQALLHGNRGNPMSSPPAAPSSEDSGISASSPPRPSDSPSVLQPLITASESPESERGDVSRGGTDRGRPTLSHPPFVSTSLPPIQQPQKTPQHQQQTYAEDETPSPPLRMQHTTSGVSHPSDSDDTELALTLVILEQDEGVGEGEQRDRISPKPRERLLTEISEVLRQRRDAERRRHLLVEKATELQHRVRVRREKSQHALREQLFTAKKAAIPLEEACSSLRLELDAAHRQLLASLEGRELPLRIRDGPSKKANYKITAARLQHEIKDLQQKVNAVKLRLESEVKLKSQADREVRQLRAELSQKKVSVSTLRSQLLGTLNPERGRSSYIIKAHH